MKFLQSSAKSNRWAGSFACLLALLFAVTPAMAQPMPKGADHHYGWMATGEGMHHFLGLDCPDRLYGLTRTRVLTADMDRLTGCAYKADEGSSIIIRLHDSGAGKRVMRVFAQNYSNSGFGPIRQTASAVTFRGLNHEQKNRVETLWVYSAGQYDISLWADYERPFAEGYMKRLAMRVLNLS